MSEYGAVFSKFSLYVRVQYQIKNHTIRPSIVFFSKSYCMSECNTSYYTTECSILFKNRIVCPSAIHHTARPSVVFLLKFVLYVRVQYIILYDRVQYSFQKFVLYIRVQYIILYD